MIKSTKDKILNVLSRIKILPGTFNVSGEQTRSIHDQVKIGDILLKGYKRYLDCYFRCGHYHHSAIYIGGGNVAFLTETGVKIQDIISFCRCDRIIILRVYSEKYDEIVERALRRIQQFLDVTKLYDCTFGNINHRLYSLDFIDMCYKELNFIRTNNKLSGISFLENKNLEVIYGNDIQIL